jgi:hypothetical protein
VLTQKTLLEDALNGRFPDSDSEEIMEAEDLERIKGLYDTKERELKSIIRMLS